MIPTHLPADQILRVAPEGYEPTMTIAWWRSYVGIMGSCEILIQKWQRGDEFAWVVVPGIGIAED